MRISDWSSDVCSSDLPRTVAAERPITVRDIMRHTAGFAYGAGPTPAHDAFVAADPLALTNSLAEASRRIASVPLLFQPGTQWSYSAAVNVKAGLFEKIAGERFDDHVRTHIFLPIKLTETARRESDAT